MPSEYRLNARVIGAMPPYAKVAEAIWGEGVDFDSDGDSSSAEDTTWRELSVIKRPKTGFERRVDIDPIADDRDLLVLESDTLDLLNRAFEFLVSVGAIERAPD